MKTINERKTAVLDLLVTIDWWCPSCNDHRESTFEENCVTCGCMLDETKPCMIGDVLKKIPRSQMYGENIKIPAKFALIDHWEDETKSLNEILSSEVYTYSGGSIKKVTDDRIAIRDKTPYLVFKSPEVQALFEFLWDTFEDKIKKTK